MRKSFSIETFTKIICISFLVVYLFWRLSVQIEFYQKHPTAFSFFSWLNWGLVMLQLVFYIVAYSIREPAKKRASRLREVLIPLICVVLPFFLIESVFWLKDAAYLIPFFKPFYIQGARDWNLLSIIFIIGGDVLIVTALLYLKKSFSIFTEVRSLVTKGPYRIVKHPMYVGESLSMIGILFLAPSWFNILIVAVFIVMLFVRARFEEAKISEFYPQYC
jgi:isoprenylcysteine carboxyl methyltransferase (ICMT) family protein YpbQ